MKNIFAFLLALVLSMTVSGQTIKKEYYDYRQTQIMAQYQVNGNGEKHGWFKGYDREGIVVYEFNYKNNLQNGLNKEYATYTGSRTLSQSETYQAGILNGPAIYYAENKGGGGTRIMSEGSYLKGEKHGKWTYTNPFDAYGMPAEWKSKAEYIQFDKYYENGKEVYPDSEITSFYLPSKQPSSITIYRNGKEIGEPKGYFPDGSIASEKKYDENGELLFEKTYHTNGQLKGSVDLRSGKRVYEGYNEDGSLDKTMVYEQQQREKAKRDNAITLANNTLNQDNLEEAISMYNDLGINTEYLEYFSVLKKQYEKGEVVLYNGKISNTDSEGNEIPSNDVRGALKTKFWSLVEKKGVRVMKSHEKYCSDYIERKTIEENEIKKEKDKLNKEVDEVANSYKTLNLVQTKTTMTDGYGRPIMSNEYLKDKIIYLKSMLVVDLYMNEFLKEEDLEKKTALSVKIKKTIETLNAIPESNWKDLRKQLKKIDDPEQIKAILKI